MRWVLLGKFGEVVTYCVAYVLEDGDVVAAVLQPKARGRDGWDEGEFRRAVRCWAWGHRSRPGHPIGIQYDLGRGRYEVEWLLGCPRCGAGPFLWAETPSGQQAFAPMRWTPEELARCLEERFGHTHDDGPPGQVSEGTGQAEDPSGDRSSTAGQPGG